jgi:FkbM family methyltransferase
MAALVKPVKRLARAAGISVTRHPAPNTLERHLKDLVRLLGVNCVLDVGAHEGAYARLLRDEVGFGGHIASFEPAASNYARLVASRRGDRRWRGYRYALGREPAMATLNLYDKSQLNSLLTPSSYGIGLFPTLAGATATEAVEVPVKPIYEGMPSFSTLLEWLRGPGFELTGAFPVSRDRDHLRLVELDCILCRATPP